MDVTLPKRPKISLSWICNIDKKGYCPNIYAVLCIQAMQLTHPYGLVVTIWPTQEIGLGQQASNKLIIMKFDALFCQLIIMNNSILKLKKGLCFFLPSKRIALSIWT